MDIYDQQAWFEYAINEYIAKTYNGRLSVNVLTCKEVAHKLAQEMCERGVYIERMPEEIKHGSSRDNQV